MLEIRNQQRLITITNNSFTYCTILTVLGATYPDVSPAPPDKLNKSPRPPVDTGTPAGGSTPPPPVS